MLGDRVAEKLLSFVIMKRWSGGCQPTTRAALRGRKSITLKLGGSIFISGVSARDGNTPLLIFCSGSYLSLL